MSETNTPPADPQVPLSVLDRFIKLSQENNVAYGAMVSALDAMSTRSMEMADILDNLSRQITEEKLADTIKDSVHKLRCDVQTMKMAVDELGPPKYNLTAAIAAHLNFAKASETEIQEHAKALLWFLRLIGLFHRNRTLFAFAAGALGVSVLGSAGMTVWDIIKFLVERM